MYVCMYVCMYVDKKYFLMTTKIHHTDAADDTDAEYRGPNSVNLMFHEL